MPLTPKQIERLNVVKTAYGNQSYVISLSPEQTIELVLNGKVEVTMGDVGAIIITIRPGVEPK